jgi:sulfonate transport system substrate-binding protein
LLHVLILLAMRVRVAMPAMVVLVVALLASACGSPSNGPGGAGKPFTLRVGMTTTNGVISGNVAWGRDKGIFEQELKPVGVDDIQFATFQAGPDVQSALMAGAIDVAITGDMPALQARGTPNAAPTRQIGFSSIDGDTWLIGQKNGPTSVKGLIGKTVAAPTDTVRYRFIYGLLADEGLLGKVTLSNLGTPESIAALRSGAVDAISVTGTQAAQLAADGYPVLDKASNHPDLLSTEQTTALQSFLDSHPGFATAWGNALAKTNSDLRAHPEAYWQNSSTYDRVDVKLESIGDPVDAYNVTPFPQAGIEQLESTYDFLVSQKLIQQPFSVDTWLLQH